MKKGLFILFCIHFITSAKAQQLVSSTLFDSVMPNPPYYSNKALIYKVLYETKDLYGNLDTASGALAVPVLPNCSNFPEVVYFHGTIFEKNEVPSAGFEIDILELASANGAISMAPDYSGMGNSRGIHPFLHAQTEATTSLDFIRACRQFLTNQSLTLNGELYFIGYSQGGHACMATHKYVQDSSLYAEFNIVGNGPNSGPYDLSMTSSDTIFKATSYQIQAFIPYLINSMDMAYGLYDSLVEYFKPPYDSIISEWLDGNIQSWTFNGLLPSSLSLYLQDSIFFGFDTNMNHPLRLAFEKQNVYRWAPTRTLKMGYCEADHLVPYTNSIKALDTMTYLGSTVVTASSYGAANDHFQCAQPSLQDFGIWILSNATPCQNASIQEYLETKTVVYPNPSNAGELNIIAHESLQLTEALIFDASSRLIKRISLVHSGFSNQFKIQVHDLTPGTYNLSLIDKNYKIVNKKIQIVN